jgi:hypothetical protein
MKELLKLPAPGEQEGDGRSRAPRRIRDAGINTLAHCPQFLLTFQRVRAAGAPPWWPRLCMRMGTARVGQGSHRHAGQSVQGRAGRGEVG